MSAQLAPLSEIEDALRSLELVETNNSQFPLMSRVMIGYDPGEPEDPDPQNWKNVMLEIGLERTGDEDFEWYWEISIRDFSTTEFIIKRHNTGLQAHYKPSCSGCFGLPMEIEGKKPEDFVQLLIKDIAEHFNLD
ncbi:MAG: hypothetical protein QM405_05915 [Euryarchaeota archaeon]|nr:hypothetical protein [Euryarchaeota archaeon]HNS26335.1 hypothetical protein [Methanobacteriaceae archaeon]